VDKCNALQLNDQWYINLIDECKDIIVETEFTSRWALVEGYHLLGTRILGEYDNFERIRMGRTELVNSIAQSLGKKKRTIYYAVKFASLYPDLNLLPEGKNISFHHIINKYLTEGEKSAKISPTEMIKQIKDLLEHEWLKANQELALMSLANYNYAKTKHLMWFIRYLQDQVDKITGG